MSATAQTARSGYTADTAMQIPQRPWWVGLIMGIVAVVIGAVLLWAPAKTQANTYLLLVTLLGFYWLVDGIIDIVRIFSDRTGWGWRLFMGIIGIMAGGWILMYPRAAALELPQIFVLVLGLWGIMHGILLIFMAFRGAGWAAGILGAVVAIVQSFRLRSA
jgi:uncharacterized membrane protein HdeD (DUF308 family)